MYVELHAASAFSFLQGASLPETLVERAAALGYPALALLDADGVYGAPRFHKAAQRAGLRAIIGAELTITDTEVDSEQGSTGARGHGERRQTAGGGPQAAGGGRQWRLPVLVAEQRGYQNLCRLVTRMKMRGLSAGSAATAAEWRGKADAALRLDDLDGCTGGLVAIAGRAV